MEASGIVRQVGPGVTELQPGDRVSIIGIGLCRTCVRVSRELVTMLPDEVSLQDAATMGVVYMTALYSLINIGNLQKGQVSPASEEPFYPLSPFPPMLFSTNSLNSPF